MVREFVLPFAVISVLASLLIPLPPGLLDFLLVANILLALILFGSTLYIPDPLKLSALPSILLLTTLYRLALNVSTTRAILGDGFGGHVVEAFGSVVVGDNLVVGLVVFLIVTLIQFIVIAKGAERIAEVAARFTLDALPGKQMSIDADVRAGLIGLADARNKRDLLQVESRFYGALDGAMKFIKGDAIAGIVITAINIAGGLALGVLGHELELTEALSKFTLLTVGDGLAAQIPALLNSLAAGMVVTRVQRGDNEPLATEVLNQLFQVRRGQLISAAVAVILGLVPGMPSLPFLLLAGLLSLNAVFTRDSEDHAAKAAAEFAFKPKVPALLGLRMGRDAAQNLSAEGSLLRSVENFRQRVFSKHGLILPQVEFFVEETLGARCQLLLRGVPIFEGALDNYTEKQKELFEILFQISSVNIVELIDDQVTRQMLDHLERSSPELVSAVVPDLATVTQITDLLKNLLHEGVPVRNLDLILQALAEHAPLTKENRRLYEEVRISLKRLICHTFSTAGEIKAVLLPAAIDLAYASAERGGELVELEDIAWLAKEVSEVSVPGAVILVSRSARRLLRECLELQGVTWPVLAHEEILCDAQLRVIKQIEGRAKKNEVQSGRWAA